MLGQCQMPDVPSLHIYNVSGRSIYMMQFYAQQMPFGPALFPDGGSETADGLVMSDGSSINMWNGTAQPISMKMPDGTIQTWHFLYRNFPGYQTGVLAMNTHYRLQSVTNNLGYQIHFQYEMDNPSHQSHLGAFHKLVKATAINNSVYVCSPTATVCSGTGGGVTWPSLTYGTDGSEVDTVTDSLGNQVRYGYVTAGGNRLLVNVKSPAALTQNDLTIQWAASSQQLTIVDAAGSWVYNWANNVVVDLGGAPAWDYPGTQWVSISGPGGFSRQITVGGPTTGLLAQWKGQFPFGPIKDMRFVGSDTVNGRTTSYEYNSNAYVSKITRPDGTISEYTYNARKNVTVIRDRPVAGSGLPDTYRYAEYPEPSAAMCVNAKTCNKPVWATIPGLASGTPSTLPKTDIVYDATHGGVLTETAPAPGSGPYASVRPQKRYTYNNGGVGVWRVETEKSCRTLASCAGTADELVVQTSYDAKRRPVRVVTRSGDLALAIGASCPNDPNEVRCSEVNMTYTAAGDIASVDGPVLGSADTSYTTYDSMRRKIFEIGPDPDGVGTGQPRLVVKHTYNADGNVTLMQAGVGTTTNGSDFVARHYTATTYDSFGRVTRTETGKY